MASARGRPPDGFRPGSGSAGRQTLKQDPRDVRVTYAYDAAGQLVGRLYPDASRATFLYDAAGNRVTMQDASGIATSTHVVRNVVVDVIVEGIRGPCAKYGPMF